MYKILIVDDDFEVREGIKECMDWHEHGFEFVGDYANGSEALEAIEERKPDLVLSDICMPIMDGIELTKRIQFSHPYTKVIILTGYDDFNYAQQALRLKVNDFIVKPITADELRALLDKVKQEMDKENENRENMSKLKKQLQQSLPLLKERFLEQMINRSMSATDIQERLQYFQLPRISAPCLVVVVDVDEISEIGKGRWENDPEILRFAVYNVIEEVMEGREAIFFRTREGSIIVILYGKDEEVLYEDAFNIAEVMRFCVEKYLKLTVTIGVGIVCSTLSELPLSYKGAISALDYRYLLGHNRVISILDMESTQTPSQQLDIDWSLKFSTLIRTGTYSEAQSLIEQLVSSLKASLMPIGTCYLQIQSIVIAIVNTIHDLLGNQNDLVKHHGKVLLDINNLRTLDEIEIWLNRFCNEAITSISQQRSDLITTHIRAVIDYIEQHYSDENLSLQDICRHVHMSKSYFSVVFKQRTEQTIMEYVTKVRLEKAKELLQCSSLRAYEIASKIGYSDPQYFSVLFKKQTGASPTEYRDRLSKEKA
ncbi:response regulator [Paenibacillus sp. N3.4]|uniref:response regulator n=1 Tax=Paenibacillus sp. N3.4 TaxID=2603222 RepID=UPI0011CB0B2F|nr:response regulator [Paenibacillus sp. N3.4]TXK77831.1 response regulator [Paenibacillus sp. N3.4]